MIVHATVDAGRSSICPYPPAPQNSLFFYINDQVSVLKEGESEMILQPRAVIVGPQVSRVSLDINRNHKAVRVGFHPGGLYRFLGIPMKEMVDESYAAEIILGKEIGILNEQLHAANEFDDIHQLIESFLLRRIAKLETELPFDKAMLYLLSRGGNCSMEKLASLACLSLRQFERISHERIGFSPKFFARITRFSKAYRMRENNPDQRWTDIAYECEYFDQMHLIRDFKQFAGVSPAVMEKELNATKVRLQAGLRL